MNYIYFILEVNGFVVNLKRSLSSKRSLLYQQPMVNNKYVTKSRLEINNKYNFGLRMASADDYYKGLDAYQILDIPRSADKKDIKSAYRKG